LEEALIANAERMGGRLMQRLHELGKRQRLIGDVRGKGLMVGVELVRDRQTKEPAVAERNAVVQECFQRGLLLLGCGQSALRFCPPLVVNENDVDMAVEIVDAALHHVAALQR